MLNDVVIVDVDNAHWGCGVRPSARARDEAFHEVPGVKTEIRRLQKASSALCDLEEASVANV